MAAPTGAPAREKLRAGPSGSLAATVNVCGTSSGTVAGAGTDVKTGASLAASTVTVTVPVVQRGSGMPAEVPAHWAVYFLTDDLDAAMARVGELGGTVQMGPMDIQPGRISAVADPVGANFYLFEPKR